MSSLLVHLRHGNPDDRWSFPEPAGTGSAKAGRCRFLLGRLVRLVLTTLVLTAAIPSDLPARDLDGVVIDRAAAVVEGEVITLSDLQWLIRYRNLPVPDGEEERRDFYLEVLHQVIEQKLIASEALQTPGILITRQDVDRQIEGYRSRFPSEEDFQRRLREMEMGLSDLRDLFQRQLAVLRFIQVRFDPFIIILPDQIETYYSDILVPQLEQFGQPAPPLPLVEEEIRQILTLERTNQEMDRWVSRARQRASVEVLLFRDPPGRPNLPRSMPE